MFKKAILVALVAFTAVATGHALTIDFDSPTPAGVSFSGQYIVADTFLPSYYAPPSPQSGNFYATYNKDNPYAPSASTISLGGTYESLSFTWGSVDSYNTLELLRNGLVVQSVGGSKVMDPADGNQGPSGTMTYTTSGVAFDSIRFLTGTNSFEVDNINVSSRVPDGGTTAVLLGLTMVGLAAVRSKLGIA